MNRAVILLAAGASCLAPAWGQEPIVFRSDVSLVRIDAQVVDAGNRAIIHLSKEDFVVREEGRPQPIRNFASEEMPIDVLFLLDVSASMRPHVQRIADAAGQAFAVLGANDRLAIMVFDRSTRVRIRFSSSRAEVQREFDRLLRQEQFNGGTDITRAMFDAADYIRREGRQEARRAIVILTDDRTQLDRDDAGVQRSLARADAVMCALIAPDASEGRQYPGGRHRHGNWGSGGGIGGPRGNRGTGGGYANHSAGTSEIARDSGGDSMSVNDASALEDTLTRLRQRYTLFFNLPEGVEPGQERNISLDLTPEARRRYADAEVRYRRASMSPGHDQGAGPALATHAPGDQGNSTSPGDAPVVRRRRVAVNEDGSQIGSAANDSPGDPNSAAPAPAPKGWPKADPTKQQ